VKLVIALGGHALAPPGGASLAAQQAAAERAARAIAPLARAHAVLVTHGNGPQIGWLANAQRGEAEPTAFDALGAESEGLIGYWLALALRNALPSREVIAALTLTEVDADDPAFAAPSKPIGPVVSADEAERLRGLGFACAPSRGGFRRVVASPAPRRILEEQSLRALWNAGALAICAGGGGIPVARDAAGRLAGAAAVVDKDRSAALLAAALGAEGLLLLTDVDAVYADWPLRREPIRDASARALRERRFESGSMAPKVEAACAFAESAGRRAWIGALEDASAIVQGAAGTAVRSETSPELPSEAMR
jgi:carbamate kinase